MTDKQIKAPKPAPIKPASTKPSPVKPEPVKPVKAIEPKISDMPIAQCLRCERAITLDSGKVRSLCSVCNLDLQHLHHKGEQVVFGKVMYMSERAAQALRDRLPPEHATKVHKSRRPYFQNELPATTLAR